MGYPHQHRGPVAKQRDHLGQLFADRGLEEARLVRGRVVGVGEGEREVRDHQHPGLVSAAVELLRQHVPVDAQDIQVGLPGQLQVVVEGLLAELV